MSSINGGEQQFLIMVGDVPGGVLVDVSGPDYHVARRLQRAFITAARRDGLRARVLADGPDLFGGFAFMVRIDGINQEQAARALGRFLGIENWQTLDLRGL